MGNIDLHTHSTGSDGTDTPEELIKKAKYMGLSAIAITDHDTFAGVEEALAAGEKYDIEVIKGAELSASESGAKFHILGYFFNESGTELSEYFEMKNKFRRERVKKICEKLNDVGINLKYKDVVPEGENISPGRANVAKALVDKNYVSNVSEAFNKYLIKGAPAYVAGMKITPEEAIRLIRENGGKPYLAHLNQINLSDKELSEYLEVLKCKGLEGIEGYYSEYSINQSEKYIGYAQKLNLKISGGSDYHGEVKPAIFLGTGMGNLRIPYSVLEKIKN